MAQKPYPGKVRSLAIAFDVGTTYSGIAYSFLEPDEVPKINVVTRFPGHEENTGSSKIPSILLYDSLGQVRAAGAEAALADNVEKAADEGWTQVEWFKLRLCPQRMPEDLRTQITRFPAGKKAVDVFADFLGYLFQCVRDFIIEASPNGAASWAAVRDNIKFIISHPNGWEGPQQSKLRRAAILAGLVPGTPEGRSRVTFVTEGEASLHYCLANGLMEGLSDPKDGFVIADLGGGTLDFSAYRIVTQHPIQVEEIAASRCSLQGSTFVTLRATVELHKRLEKSPYGTADQVKSIAAVFDKTAKRTFRSAEDTCNIRFGSLKDNDPAVGIRAGQIKLAGATVAGFFQESIDAAVHSIASQSTESRYSVTSVCLVGGYCASPYIVKRIKEQLQKLGIETGIPDGQTSKAVASGAISFYLDRCVASRMSKVTYGTCISRAYQPLEPEHMRRRHKSFMLPSGRVMIPDAYQTILEKGTLITENYEFVSPLCKEVTNKEQLSRIETTITTYHGPDPAPQWTDNVDKSHFRDLLRIRADTESLKHILQRRRGKGTDQFYYLCTYDVVILFGLTELQAQIRWTENGVERRSPAHIIYEDVPDEEEDEEEDAAPVNCSQTVRR